MATALDLITDALTEIGVADSVTPVPYEDAALSLRMLNRFIDQWALSPLAIHHVTRTEFDITANTGTYVIGEGLGTDTTDGFDTLWTTAPDGWSRALTGDATITNDTTTYHAGGHSIAMEVTASGTASLIKDFIAPSGASITIAIQAMATFANAGFVRVQNLDTAKYLTSAGAWQTAEADIFEADAGVAFVAESLTFTVESAATIGANVTTLRVTLRQDDTTAVVHFDSFSIEGATTLAIPRPVSADRINDVRLQDTSTDPDTETPLVKLTDDAWAAITLKDQTSTYPTHWYYNPTYPYGTLYLWPVPTGSSLQGVIYVPTQTARFEALSDTVSLPPGYEEMIVTNLAVRLCQPFQRQVSPDLRQRAADAMALVKRSNKRTAELSFPAGALIGRGGTYDIQTDQ